jgi:signal transduction histidine kinase
MLQSLLDRDRASRGIIARAPTKLDELARRVVAALDPGDHHVHLECAAVSAEVDPVMVERIVDNLVRNALKHTPGDSNIWVSVAPTNGGTQIVVEDDGPGVGDDLQGAMFDRFRSGETEEGGSGVGLWLVEKFTRLHDGTVSATERAGGGASFRVYLPDS